METFIIGFIKSYLLVGVFALLIGCGLGIPIPEDVVLLTGGYFSYLYPTHVNFYTLIIVAMAGVLIGDTTIFMIGRHFGPRVVTLPVLKRILTRERLDTMTRYFETYGNRIIFMGRFMAGLRAPLFMSAGVTGFPYKKFIIFDGLAAMISVPLLIMLANRFGDEIELVKQMLVKTHKVLLIAIPLFIVVWYLFKHFIWDRRRDFPDDPDDTPMST